MKVVLLMLATIAAVSGQTEPWCRCAAFVTYEYYEIMVHEEPEIPIDSCDANGALQCKTTCADNLDTLSDNGNLWKLMDSGLTIGQDICSELADHFTFFLYNHKVYGYFEVCGGAWQYAGIASQQKLCCEGGKQHHCID
ncbi:uncharacterized protein LOC121872971 [Homarus americanus]|uniref:uncharacterized protein LOC121872971 n=1 Tax=Homarus americanus TaxID=6706 RepID=UPI001C465828|nr:uncharacterized protein LOC121872971 [Homarus americanus]